MQNTILLSVIGLLVSVMPSLAVAQVFAPKASQDAAQTRNKSDDQCEDKRDDCESQSRICFFFETNGTFSFNERAFAKGCSEVERWRFCLTPLNGGMTNGPVISRQGFNFVKPSDNASPKLLQALVTQTNIGTVVLIVKTDDGKKITYTFGNVTITNYSQAVVKECEEPVEDITFTYQTLSVQYDGGKPVVVVPPPVSGVK